ncbi:MAG: hypothetical protein Q4C87_07330 [Actinomycetaceae bacterium]|nr:hypothetical protein [Actinomycetaceae bacterium]
MTVGSKQWSDKPRVVLEKAKALLHLGKNEAALKELSTITSIEPSILHELNVYMAQACINLGRKDEAFRHAKESIRHKPRAYRGHYMLGLVEEQRWHYSAALEALEEARNLAPHEAVVYQRLGLVHAQMNQHIKARQAAQQALSLAPHDADTHYSVAYVEFNSQTGDRAVVEEALRRTLSIDPQHRGAVMLLGRLRAEQTGDISERVKGLVEAQKMDPTDPIVVSEFDRTIGRILLINTAAILISYVLFLGISDEGLGRALFFITAQGVCITYLLIRHFVAYIRGNPQGWKHLLKGYPRRERLFFWIFVGQGISWFLMTSAAYAYLINNQVSLEPISRIAPIFFFPLPLIVIIIYGGRALSFLFKAVFRPESKA